MQLAGDASPLLGDRALRCLLLLALEAQRPLLGRPGLADRTAGQQAGAPGDGHERGDEHAVAQRVVRVACLRQRGDGHDDDQPEDAAPIGREVAADPAHEHDEQEHESRVQAPGPVPGR